MKFLVSATLLLTLGSCVDVWTSFLNEQGEEYDMNAFGVELADNWSASKGGSGGGEWTEDCGCHGIEEISMECGKYVGMLKVKCGGHWKSEHGLGKANGHGGHYTISGVGITKIQINAGSYVDRIEFFKGGSAHETMLKRCGDSNGGGRFSAEAPAGMHLCGLSGRAGWWMDQLKAGWCYHKRDCKLGPFNTCGDCNKSTGKKTCNASVTQTAKCDGKACGSSSQPQDCPVNCEQGGWSCNCNRQTGVSSCSRSTTVTAKNGGAACGDTTKTEECQRDCQVGGFGAWTTCRDHKQQRHRTTVPALRGGNACPSNTSEEQCCEMNGHRCTPGQQHQCCGNRCCSQYGWCGGSRDKKYDAWCGHSAEFLNHVAGFHSEVGDISVVMTSGFAAVILLPTFAVYKFFSRQSERAEYEALLDV